MISRWILWHCRPCLKPFMQYDPSQIKLAGQRHVFLISNLPLTCLIVFRAAQKRVVNVYRLITRGTLEEKIMGLQKFKMSIANTVISQDNASLQSMGTDQLLNLFTLDKVRPPSVTDIHTDLLQLHTICSTLMVPIESHLSKAERFLSLWMMQRRKTKGARLAGFSTVCCNKYASPETNVAPADFRRIYNSWLKWAHYITLKGKRAKRLYYTVKVTCLVSEAVVWAVT